jgi:hypothetical protein
MELEEAVNPTAAQRKKYGMSDGSFPVWNQDSLDSAVKLSGRSKSHSPAEVRAHIRRAASKLGLSLPDSWREADDDNDGDDVEEAVDAQDVLAMATGKASRKKGGKSRARDYQTGDAQSRESGAGVLDEALVALRETSTVEANADAIARAAFFAGGNPVDTILSGRSFALSRDQARDLRESTPTAEDAERRFRLRG